MDSNREYANTIQGAKESIEKLDGQILETTTTQQNLSKEWDYAEGYIKTYSENATKDIKEVDDAVKGMDKTFKNTDISGRAKGILKKFVKTFDDDTSAAMSVKTWLQSISTAITNWKAPQVNLPTLMESTIGEYSPFMNTRTVPQYATGAFVKANTPHLAVVGDNTQEGEIISPESKFQEMLNAAASLSGGGGLSEEVLYRVMSKVLRENQMVLVPDENGIVKTVKKGSDEYRKATGKPLFGY